MSKHVVSRYAFAKAITRRVREERLTERARIVQFLGFVLLDNADTREAIADVFNGEPRRVCGVHFIGTAARLE